MSQQKKLELSKRIREFRIQSKLSQEELGERLGISGNYVSMIELAKKDPGPSLQKLFETLEQSPLYGAGGRGGHLGDGSHVARHILPPNPVLAMLSAETLETNFGEIAEKLMQVEAQEKKRVVASLREMLDEIERRLLLSSGALSEAQEMAVKASRPGGTRGTK
jgi:transcriptional regulator with XRE-family HTH domain